MGTARHGIGAASWLITYDLSPDVIASLNSGLSKQTSSKFNLPFLSARWGQADLLPAFTERKKAFVCDAEIDSNDMFANGGKHVSFKEMIEFRGLLIIDAFTCLKVCSMFTEIIH